MTDGEPQVGTDITDIGDADVNVAVNTDGPAVAIAGLDADGPVARAAQGSAVTMAVSVSGPAVAVSGTGRSYVDEHGRVAGAPPKRFVRLMRGVLRRITG